MSAARRSGWAAVADVAAVLLFVVIGRASHGKGETLAGIASTAWPFLAGLGIGWLAAWSPGSWRQVWRVWPEGVTAWLATVAAGMVLRVVAGQGTAVAFIVVALIFLGLFLLGWRLAARLITRTRLGGRRRGERTFSLARSDPHRAGRPTTNGGSP